MSEDGRAVIADPLAIVPADQPRTMPDGTPILSGPMPEGTEPRRHMSVATIVPNDGTIIFSGVAGGAFAIYGRFGAKPGTVVVGNVQASVTSWRETAIKGLLSSIADPMAEVTVKDGDGKTYKRPTVVEPALAAAAAPAQAKK